MFSKEFVCKKPIVKKSCLITKNNFLYITDKINNRILCIKQGCRGVQKVRKSSYTLYEYNAANVFIFTTLMSKGREDIA